MELAILVIAFVVLGYFLSARLRDRKFQVTNKEGDTVRQTLGTISELPKRRNKQKRLDITIFITWATGPGAQYFPESLQSWWRGFSEPETNKFIRSLQAYLQNLDLQIQDFIAVEKESQPERMSTFVDAVIVFSNEYRRASQVVKDAQAVNSEVSPGNETSQAPITEGKIVAAEKQPSRRKAAALRDSRSN